MLLTMPIRAWAYAQRHPGKAMLYSTTVIASAFFARMFLGFVAMCLVLSAVKKLWEDEL